MKRLTSAALAGLLLLTPALSAGEVSPIQSSARPYGLQPIAPVQLSGSDARAQDFNDNFLPYFRELINTKLSESVDFTDREGFRLDASRLFLRTESDLPIRIYFVHEGAGYHNSLGFSATPVGAPQQSPPHLIFPDASFHGPWSGQRTPNDPMVVGDFVEIDNGAPGVQLDFFIVANGAGNQYSYGGTNIVGTWFNNPDLNADGLQHAVAFLLPDSRYVMIGFEDLWGGGDLDYNDCLFVVDIGEVNAENFGKDPTLPN